LNRFFPFGLVQNFLRHKSENEELRRWENTKLKDGASIYKMEYIFD